MSQLEDEAPSTIKEVGIHLAYVRRDLTSLIHKVDELPNGFATKSEMLELKNRLDKLENIGGSWWKRFGVPTAWTVGGAIALGMILSFLDRLK